jgi:hypothetical protein
MTSEKEKETNFPHPHTPTGNLSGVGATPRVVSPEEVAELSQGSLSEYLSGVGRYLGTIISPNTGREIAAVLLPENIEDSELPADDSAHAPTWAEGATDNV